MGLPTVLLFGLTVISATPPSDAFLQQLAATRGFRNGAPTQVQVGADGRWVLFLRSPPTSPVQALYAFDVQTGKTTELLTAEALLHGAAQALSPAERAQLERQRVSARGFTSFQLSEDGGSLVAGLSGGLYWVNLAALRAGQPATHAVRALPPMGVLDPALSPDGRMLSYVKDWDLHVLDIASGQERELTSGGSERFTHGLAEFVAQEEMGRFRGAFWSPDGRMLAYEEADTREVETFTLADPTHPEAPAARIPYPRPGKSNAVVRLGLVAARGGPTTWVRWDAERYPYLARVVWPDRGPLTLLVQNRTQTSERLLAVDVRSGATRTLLEETDAVWLNLADPGRSRRTGLPLWLPDGSGFFWVTERNGGNEVELRNADGTLRKRWLSPEARTVEVVGWDATEHALYVLAAPEPPETVILRAREGAAPERMFAAGGRAEQALLLPDRADLRVVTTTTATSMPRWEVYDRAGKRLGELPSLAPKPLLTPRVEIRKVGATSGFWSYVVRPEHARAGEKLPVIVSCYGGPHAHVVTSAMPGYLLEQWRANQGFLVVGFDGRGTPRRGRAWERAIRGDFSGPILDDQVAALHALAREVPEMDLSRVGITGWSFGGYLSALAVLKRPDVFRAAVAGAPVVDFRDYDTHYTERYLGLPETSPEAYRKSSLLTYAAGLERPLLLIHGTTDDNVYFLHSLKLSDALFRAGRPHTLLPLSGFTHMVADPVMTERLARKTVDFFREHLH